MTTALMVGKWSLGRTRDGALTLLRLEFSDRDPINLSFPTEEAVKIAAAIVEQNVAALPSRN